MYTLRSNQIEPVQVGIDYFSSGSTRPGLIVAPTAFGKSLVIAHVCKEIKGKTVVLQPSVELLNQNYEKFTALGGEASIYSASKGIKEFGDVTYATIGTIKSIGDVFQDWGYENLIVDEPHMYPRGTESMFGKFMKKSEIKKVLGLTATPFKLQTNSVNMESYSILSMLTSRSKKGQFFKDILHVTQIQDIVRDGFWAKLVYEVYDFDSGELVYNSTKADYTEESLNKSFENQDIGGRILEWLENSDRQCILVFVPSVQTAIDLSLETPNSAAIYSDMHPSERARILSEFKAGKIRVIYNVNILSVGYDNNRIDAIAGGRPTASLAWWYQAGGRGTRLFDGKEDCLIVDFAGNVPKFGKFEELYYKKVGQLWKLYGEGGKLITGIPLDRIGDVTEESEAKEREFKQIRKEAIQDPTTPRIITFGKYKGKEVKETPGHWRRWMLENFDWDEKTVYIKDEIIRLKR